MKETDCRKCCVCAFKEDLCNGDFCEKYYREGNAEDFEKLLPHWIPCSEPEWISTKETQPPKPNGAKYYSLDGEDIAADEYNVMIKGATEPTSLFWSGDVWFSPYGIDAGYTYNVTHWMPLPKPPKEGEQQ